VIIFECVALLQEKKTADPVKTYTFVVCSIDCTAFKSNVLRFGEVPISESRTLSFTMTNHSDSAVKFTWPEDSNLTFSPRIGNS